MTDQPGIPDIAAMCDVLDDLTERTDTMSADQAVALMHAVTEMGTKVKALEGLLRTRLIVTLEGQPKRIGNTTYIPEATGKYETNHGKIRSRVASLASVDADGELLPARAAADRAVDFMVKLFVAPSSEPKIGGLKELGLVKDDVCSWVKTGTKLKEVVSPNHD
jgi:hypothetical protein